MLTPASERALRLPEGSDVSQTWKTVVIVLAVLGIASTPVIWLLESPDAGQLVGASVQAAVGIAALVWALFQGAPASSAGANVAVDTGTADAKNGGRASTGVRRPKGKGRGSATARRTGDANATGPGSSASSGVDYS